MFYRIYLDPKSSKWQIQLCKWTFLGLVSWWETLKEYELKGKDAVSTPLAFDSYDTAQDYVSVKGLDQAYTNIRYYPDLQGFNPNYSLVGPTQHQPSHQDVHKLMQFKDSDELQEKAA